MKSQKQRNRAPRPFKNKDAGGWAGGRDKKNFIPSPRPFLLVKKDALPSEPPATVTGDGAEAEPGES
jgi:hypothetical protein